MSRKLDTTNDFATVVDHVQTVTLLRPGSSLSLEIEGALCSSTSITTERSKLGKHEQHDAIWHLPIGAVAFTPILGDLILDTDGDRWTVLSFRRTMDGGRWRIIARNMVAAHDLNDFVDIDLAIFSRNEFGDEVAGWTAWRTGLPARVEILSSEFQRDSEPVGTTRQMVIHLSEAFLLDHKHRIHHADGRVFQILRCRQKPEVGATFQIDVQEIITQE